jgi:hypothetical protein
VQGRALAIVAHFVEFEFRVRERAVESHACHARSGRCGPVKRIACDAAGEDATVVTIVS